MKNSKYTREIAVYASLAAFSAVFVVFPLKFKTQWGIDIDLIAVSWIVAFLLFRMKGALVVSITGAILITLFSQAGWLGASAKFLATFSMILGMFATSRLLKSGDYFDVRNLVTISIVGFVLRGLIMLPFNYLFALKIWIPGMSTQELLNVLPWYIIFSLNVLQGILDITLAWILVYKGKLTRYASTD